MGNNNLYSLGEIKKIEKATWFIQTREDNNEYLTFISSYDSINNLSGKVDDVDMNSCKNFLVRFLADAEQGNEIDEIEKERFYEVYEHYTKKGGNSYIHDKYDKLKKSGKL